jgi:transcription elongation factor Elf1
MFKRKRKKMNKLFKCARCGYDVDCFPAMSRVDNKTDICSNCGVEEGMQQMFGEELSPLIYK